MQEEGQSSDSLRKAEGAVWGEWGPLCSRPRSDSVQAPDSRASGCLCSRLNGRPLFLVSRLRGDVSWASFYPQHQPS